MTSSARDHDYSATCHENLMGSLTSIMSLVNGLYYEKKSVLLMDLVG